MNNQLKLLKKKYDQIVLSPKEIENDYYQNVMSKYAYKKISKGPSYNVWPFDYQIGGFKKGRELKKLPKLINNTRVYYFDGNDKILLTEIYGKTERIIDREYYFYCKNDIESIYFISTIGAIDVANISLLMNKNGYANQLISYAKYGYGIWKYNYFNNTLVEIDVQCKGHDETEITFYKTYLKYNNGELNRIISKYPNGYEVQRYSLK